MTDYTPTTEDARRAWAWWRKPMMVNKHYFPDEEALFEATDRELDRWLEQVRAEAWDEGKRAGLRQSDWEHGDTPTQYIAHNPYRKEDQ